MKMDRYTLRAEELISLAERAAAGNFIKGYSQFVDPAMFSAIRSGGLSLVLATFGKQHPYYADLDRLKIDSLENTWTAKAILEQVKYEFEAGWLDDLRSLVAADIFADYMEMASHLMNEGYKDPAAVIAGSSLEEHLRELARRSEIDLQWYKDGSPIPKKADAINSELGSAGVYNKLDQKSVTAWLDLRNKAAHGRYDEYSAEQVRLMIQSVRDFRQRTLTTNA